MLRYWTAPSPTKTRETPHCLAKTLPFPLTPKAKSATTTTTTTLWVLWYIFLLNNKPLFYSYSDFVFVLFGKLLARNTYCLQTLFYTCDTSRRHNPTYPFPTTITITPRALPQVTIHKVTFGLPQLRSPTLLILVSMPRIKSSVYPTI